MRSRLQNFCPTSRPLKANYSAIYKSGKVLS